LCAKSILLSALAGAFALVVWSVAFDPGRAWWTRILVALLLTPLSAFLAWAASMALADSVLGRAVRVANAVALPSRRAGYSLRLPDGRFAEFIFHNPWAALRAHRRYAVVLGRYSRVIVAPPVEEASP
jgi:hypothetical protein